MGHSQNTLLGMISDIKLHKATCLLDNRTLFKNVFGYDKSVISGGK